MIDSMQTSQAWEARVRENLKTLRYPDAFGAAKLVAISKYVPAEAVEGAYHAGLRCFGESKAVEALRKREQLPLTLEREIEWHFIGHIQRNKLNKIVGHYALIHSVDSLKLLHAVAEKAQQFGVVQPVLLQVNVSGEAQKQGFCEAAVEAALEAALNAAPHLVVQGFMTMAPHTDDEATISACFSRLASLREALAETLGVALPHLSMGMSNDYGLALANGATITRIGSWVFA